MISPRTPGASRLSTFQPHCRPSGCTLKSQGGCHRPGIISSHSHSQTAKALSPSPSNQRETSPQSSQPNPVILLVRFASHAPAYFNPGTRDGMIRASVNQIHLPGKGPPSEPTEGEHSALSQEGRLPLGMAALLAARRVHPTEQEAPRPIQDHALGPNSLHPNEVV